MPTPHTHAELLRAIADGKTIQAKRLVNGAYIDAYRDIHAAEVLTVLALGNVPDVFRVKQATIRIGEFDVPEPLREAPKAGTNYWVADIVPRCPGPYEWGNDDADFRCLARGIVHLSSEAAEIHTRALLSFSIITEL